MAVIFDKENYNNIMTLPKSTGRSYSAPLDPTAVWNDWGDLTTYAQTDPTAYVGQILAFHGAKEAGGSTVCEAYMITGANGTLTRLAFITATDDFADDINTLYDLVAGKVDSVTAGDASITIGGTAVNPTVAVKISEASDNALSLVEDGLKVVVPEVVIPEVHVPEYSMSKLDTATDGSLATYQLTKDGAGVGTRIEIPKDLVVSSGSVVDLTAEEAANLIGVGAIAGKYLKLVFANSDAAVYILVNDLVEDLTVVDSAKNAASIVKLEIDSNHKISATINDGAITEAKLGFDVVVPTDLGTAAYKNVEAFDSAGAANAVKVELLGTDADDPSLETIRGVKAAAETNAADIVNINNLFTGDASTAGTVANKIKTAIDALDYNNTDDAGEHKFVTNVIQTDGKIAVTFNNISASDVPELDMNKITGLSQALTTIETSIGTKANSTDVYTKTAINDDIVGNLGTNTVGETTVRKSVKEYVDAIDTRLTGSISTNTTAINAINNETTGILKQAKDYADGLANNYEAAGTAQGLVNGLNLAQVECGQMEVIGTIKQENGVVTATKKTLVAGDIPTLEISKISGLQDALNNKAVKGTTLAEYGITDAYKKTEVYTQGEVDSAISTAIANIDHLKREVVESLPAGANADANTIYMVPRANGPEDNTYIEYMYINNKFERMGTTDADLTAYVKSQDLVGALPAFKTIVLPAEQTSVSFTGTDIISYSARINGEEVIIEHNFVGGEHTFSIAKSMTSPITITYIILE